MSKGSFTPSTVATNNISALPSVVVGQAITLQPLFDKGTLDTKTYINSTLIAELNGANGANKIGCNPSNLASDNVKEALEELQTNIQNTSVGVIPDGSLTDIKLSNTAGQIKSRVATAETEIDTLQADVNFIKSDTNYSLATIVSRQIRITKSGSLPTTNFKISAPITTGAQLTISLDAGATSLPLVDTTLAAITSIESGVHQVVFDTTRYILNPFGQIGSLPSLLTTIKTSIINAINELFTNKANKTQEAFIAPTLINGWVNFDVATYSSAGYFKDEFGLVHIKGFVKSGTISSPSFVLPVGYRPAKVEAFAVVSNGAFAHVDINDNGNLTVKAGNAASGVSLDGITFKAV